MGFGERLRVLRKQKGLTQEELAKLSGISVHCIASYELNTRSPKIPTIIKLALFFGVSSDMLLGLADMPVPTETSIQILRKKCGFTQKELAEQLGVSQQAVAKWENNVAFPNSQLLPLMASILNCRIEDLY